MQSTPSSVPFVEYVLRALEHPPYMFVSKLAACCATLFLTRSDPELLKSLCHKWAIRFSMDRGKLLDIILKKARQGKGRPDFCRHTCIDKVAEAPNGSLANFDADEAVDHFLRILQSLVQAYFSWNWHRTDYVIQLNKEYEAYVRENILPICIATSAEDGQDDDDESMGIFSPTSLSCPTPMTRSHTMSPVSKCSECAIPAKSHKKEASFPATGTATVSSVIAVDSESSLSDAGSSTNEDSCDYNEDEQEDSAHPFPGDADIIDNSEHSAVPLNITTSSTATASVSTANHKGALPRSVPEQQQLYSNPNSSSRQTVSAAVTPTGRGSGVRGVSPPGGLTFLSLNNYNETMRRNVSGMVIIFHAKYSARSCEVLEVFQRIIQKRPFDPMPIIAVVYLVAEPELANLYNISWFPTIIYVPAPSQRPLETPGDVATDEGGGGGGGGGSGEVEVDKHRTLSFLASSPTGSKAHYRRVCSPVHDRISAPRTGSSTTLPGSSVCHPSPTTLLFGFNVDEGHEVKNADGSGSCGASQPACSRPSTSHSGGSDMTEALTLSGETPYIRYPINGVTTMQALVEWIGSHGTAPPRLKKMKDFVTRVGALRAEQKFKQYRELHSAVVMLRQLQVTLTSDSPATTRRVGDPPLFIFLGGGMAAGKSTAAMALAHSAWWKHHKDQSVVVNADEFKVADPLYECSSANVHARSTRAAESLLVQAVNQGRSIVFDGTMMWAPFVRQVIDMVRAAHLTLYKQGPGYKSASNEVYFMPAGPRPTPLPTEYRIHLLGITVESEIAVQRGFLRKFSTGRGVSISTQLRSFKLFSENFQTYTTWVDSATLYNNNIIVDLSKGELPPVLAEMSEHTGHVLRVYDKPAYQLFLRQRTLNEDADNVLELYPGTPT